MKILRIQGKPRNSKCKTAILRVRQENNSDIKGS